MTTLNPPAASQQAAVDAALLILERMGLSPDDLTATPRQRPSVPTFALLSEAENPAARVPKPRRLPSARMALPDGRLAEISGVAASTGNDPALDSLIIRLHAETACRRGGALALTREDLDPGQCLIRLHEKGGTERWQPVSPTLMTHLLSHAGSRGGLNSGERLLRYATGKPITSRSSGVTSASLNVWAARAIWQPSRA